MFHREMGHQNISPMEAAFVGAVLCGSIFGMLTFPLIPDIVMAVYADMAATVVGGAGGYIYFKYCR